jgi:hypothetical protein
MEGSSVDHSTNFLTFLFLSSIFCSQFNQHLLFDTLVIITLIIMSLLLATPF